MERSQLDNMRQSLLVEGFLGETFVELEALQTEDEPNFAEEVMSIFYTKDSARYLQNIEQALEKTPVDFSELDNHMVRFKGCCSNFGSRRITNKCIEFRECCVEGNEDLEGCKMALQRLKEELTNLKGKLEAYFLLGRRVRAAEATSDSNQDVDHQNGVSL